MKLCKVVISANAAQQMGPISVYTSSVLTASAPIASFVCPSEMLGAHLAQSLSKVLGSGPKTRELSLSLTEIDIDDEYIVERFRK